MTQSVSIHKLAVSADKELASLNEYRHGGRITQDADGGFYYNPNIEEYLSPSELRHIAKLLEQFNALWNVLSTKITQEKFEETGYPG